MEISYLPVINFQSVIGREPRSTIFQVEEIEKLAKERILVTGAGGTIGSKITEFLSKIEDLEFLATDRDEGALHSLSLTLNSKALFDQPNIELLDIKDVIGIRKCIERFKPTLVIHAAALKHLSALQRQPREALLTNVFGTANLIDVSLDNQIKKFINISTDKVANYTSILGYTKKLAELYVAKIRHDFKFDYTSCRFGNVFNSRGSVIETFIHQIQTNKPITLTDKTIDRFFMSVEEAAHLTLKSSILNAGDVHIFDMGKPVSLESVIDKLQMLIGKRSPIIITGLRDGEKTSEVLFSKSEVASKTKDPRITYTNLTEELMDSEEIISQIKNRDELNLLKTISVYSKSYTI
jgi:FlaA1/EpsC-like NDP-sugar epimerase